MGISAGELAFILAPLVLAAILLRIDPQTRRTRPRELLTYVLIMSALIYGALRLVAWIAGAGVPLGEVVVVLWFTIAWRLAWAIWRRTVGRWGQSRVRAARIRRRRGLSAPISIRLIPVARIAATVIVFFPLFLSMVVTHRCKLTDGQDPESTFSIRFERIRIPTAEGLMLDGWFIPDAGSDRTIVICHGAGANKGNFVWFLGPLAHAGYNVLFFDFRAHGASDGRVTTYGIRERVDVLAAVDWLKRERAQQSRVIVGLGSSQGSMALALAAAEEPRIDAVILDSPFVSPRELVHGGAARLPVLGPLAADWMLLLCSLQTGTNFFTASAERAIAGIGSRPVMVIHGADDIMMPASHTQRLYDAATGPKEVWFGPGPHSNIITSAPDEYARRVFAFLGAHLGAPERGHGRRSRTE